MEGDQSFVVRFEALYRVAYRAAFAPLGVRAEAQECAQEALARALVRWRRVEDHADAWVARVSANLAIDRVRKRGRERAYVDSAHGQRSASTDVTGHRRDLVAAMASLPRQQRDVIVLRYLADLPERDVAAALGCAVGTVKSSAARGLERLRGVLGPDFALEG